MNLNQLEQLLKSHANPVVVDLWAPWCAPCRVTKPILESLAKEYQGSVDFLAINVDEHPDLLRALAIFSIPTVLVARDGKVIQRFTGARSRAAYRSIFAALSHSREAVTLSMSLFDRLFRLFVGINLAVVGQVTEIWLLIPIGVLIAFFGIYDRCPIWRAITSFFYKRTP